jgi:hypothetical protein
MEYKVKSPILFIIFNRSDTSLKVLSEIKNVKPSRLYITADGFRKDRPYEATLCEEAKNNVLKAIDWDCEVSTLFRQDNFGPKEAIASAITWFFENEEQGIILEHDCLPSISFFRFCDTLLEKYKVDQRIWLISGCNFQNGKTWGDGSYYFSNLTNGWGWATWRRSWVSYDKDMTHLTSKDVREQICKIFDHPLIIDQWVELFEKTKSGEINTWDYQATFTHLFSHAINIVPNVNLVSNIGFGEGAENTLDVDSVFANVPIAEIDEIIHPRFMVPEKEADLNTLFDEFRIEEKIKQFRKHNSYRRRFKRWLKSIAKS